MTRPPTEGDLANLAKIFIISDKPRRALLGANPMSRIDRKRPKKSAKRKPGNRKRPARLQFFLPPDENAAIDDFRYRNRMPSKAAAIRELLRRGLASGDKD